MEATQMIEGKYYRSATFKPYKKLLSPHMARELAELQWNEKTKKYVVSVITIVFPEATPEKLKNALILEGSFETQTPGKIQPADKLLLDNVQRIPVGYALLRSEKRGHYDYDVKEVAMDEKGVVKRITVRLETEPTKGIICFNRVED